MDFDNAIETLDIDTILPYFADDCRIEVLSVTLQGKEGATRWLQWLFRHIRAIRFEPVVIMVEGNIFFEEFIVHATLHDNSIASSKQAEVLLFEAGKVKELRLYFDRLDFANAITKNFVSKAIIKKVIKKSLEGLDE